MTSVSAGHIILTPTQPVGSGRPQRKSKPRPPHQESRALPLSYRAPHCLGHPYLISSTTGSFFMLLDCTCARQVKGKIYHRFGYLNFQYITYPYIFSSPASKLFEHFFLSNSKGKKTFFFPRRSSPEMQHSHF